MTSQQLLPSLFALLPPSLHSRIIAHLSLSAIHIEPYVIQDDIYLPTNPVIPQYRSLRLRARRKGKGKGIAKGEKFELSYVSNTLTSREYAEANVRAVLGVEVVGITERKEIEGFVETLGFRRSHSYTRSGLLFYLPTPLLTLHLTITRLAEDSASEGAGESSEPYIVQLEPSKPIAAVAGRGEASLQDVVGAMRDVADRIGTLEWSTGR